MRILRVIVSLQPSAGNLCDFHTGRKGFLMPTRCAPLFWCVRGFNAVWSICFPTIGSVTCHDLLTSSDGGVTDMMYMRVSLADQGIQGIRAHFN